VFRGLVDDSFDRKVNHRQSPTSRVEKVRIGHDPGSTVTFSNLEVPPFILLADTVGGSPGDPKRMLWWPEVPEKEVGVTAGDRICHPPPSLRTSGLTALD
jgi:hypothetical protein